MVRVDQDAPDPEAEGHTDEQTPAIGAQPEDREDGDSQAKGHADAHTHGRRTEPAARHKAAEPASAGRRGGLGPHGESDHDDEEEQVDEGHEEQSRERLGEPGRAQAPQAQSHTHPDEGQAEPHLEGEEGLIGLVEFRKA
jgi:hypothetical protein